MPTKLTITVSPEAETKIEVSGVTGSGCKALTKPIEDALGTVTSDKQTADYHKQPQQRQTAGGGR